MVLAGPVLGALAQTVRVTAYSHEARTFTVEVTGRAEAYYLLRRGPAVNAIQQAVAARPGQAGSVSLRDEAAPPEAGFYRVQEVPRSQPLDVDGDGMDDLWELERAPQLNPLDPADAALDPDGDGLTFLQEYLRDHRAVSRIVATSPAQHEAGVAVTRETILYFDRPLAAGTVLSPTNLFATFGGRTLLGRVELSGDRRKATLFYQENLPASARIRVIFNAAGIRDINDREVDADGDGQPGGVATVDFDTLNTAPLPQTGVIGRVFASEPLPGPGGGFTNRPLQNVTITVDGAEETLRTTTDADGFFHLLPAPAGRFFVHVDGRTAVGSDWPGGAYYPFVGKAWEAVAGVTNNPANGTGEIYLPLVPADALQPVSPTEETRVTFAPETLAEHPELEGVEIRVPPNALFDDNGTRGGRVGLAPVPPDRLPEPLPPGLDLPLVITIQTDGPMNFDRPVPVRFPNTPNPRTGQPLPPGAKSALWSFNHDTGQWEVVGPMTVTADGRFVETDPGVGVLQPGWHGQDPASRGEGDLSDFRSLPDNTGDIIWNAMNAGFGWTGVLFDVAAIVAAESPVGKFYSGLNLALDIGGFIMNPSWANATKVGLSTVALAPGGSTVIKGAQLASGAWSVYSAADATGQLGNSIQQANQNFNPGGPQRQQMALHGAGQRALKAGAVAVIPLYLAADYYQGPEQDAAVAALLNALTRFKAEADRQLPLYLDFAELCDRLIERSQAVLAQGPTPWPTDQIQDFAALANQWLALRQDLLAQPSLWDLYLETVRHLGHFQRLYDLNMALVSVGSARGFGDPLTVLLNEFARRNPMTRPTWYRLLGPDGTLRGRIHPGEPFRFITRPDQPYRLDLLNPQGLTVASRHFVGGPAGSRFALTPILTRPVDRASDTDGDGLSDLTEGIVGTRPDQPDTDGDGIRDGAEVQADTNPLDNMPSITGVIGTLPLPGTTKDVCLDGNRALVALGSAGLAVADVSRVDTPTIIARVDTPGDARSAACDRTFVAVADGSAGLAIVDISDPPGAFIANQLNRLGETTCVVAADGVAYVGTAAGEVIAVHLATGTVGNRLNLGAAIHDLAFFRHYLLAQTGGALHVVRLEDDELVSVSSQPISLFPEGITSRRRVSVSDRFAYVTSYPGYSVVDLSTPAAPVLIGNAVEHGPNSFKQLLPTGSGLGVAAVGVNPRDDGTHDVWLYDLRDPNQRTTFTAQFPTPGIAHAVALHRGLAFVADGASGLQTLNFLAADLGSTPPTIRLDATFPLNPAVAESDSFSAIIAEAHDDVLVREVEFYLDGTRVHTDGNYPFEYRFRVPTLNATRTNFVVRARAFDTGGNAAWSDALTVTITPDLTPPRARPGVPVQDGYAVSPTVISAIFNELINPDTLMPEHLTLTYLGADRAKGTADDAPVAGTVGFVAESRLAELRFSAVTNAGRYEAVLLRGVTDLAGNASTNDVVWAFEVVIGTDTDGDGLTDDFENANGFNPNNADENRNGIVDSIEDFDGDGLTNGQEMLIGTHPRLARTFNGELDRDLDRDGDYLTDIREVSLGTDWTRWDTDGDGWNDEVEIGSGDSPFRPNAYLRSVRVTARTAQVLRPVGPQYRSAQVDLMRLGEGQTMQSSGIAHALRLGGPNENGHSIVAAVPPVRARVFDLEATDLTPNELPRAGAFVIEAEDYNHGGGQHVAAASVMPYLGGAYNNLVGTLNVDYFNTDAADSQLYRPLPAGRNVNLVDSLASRFGAERPGWVVTGNWRIGWAATGDWQQYTRAIPPGEYYVWAALSHAGRGLTDLRGTLERVTGDPTQPGAATVPLGDFSAPGTGAWGDNALVLMRVGGLPATVVVDQPTTTLRFNLGSGDLDWFVLVPVISVP